MFDSRDHRHFLERIDAVLDSRLVQTVGGAINATFRLPRPVAVRVGKSILFAQTLDRLIALLVIRLGLWERAERRFIRKAVRLGDVVVDVGANVGQYTMEFSSLVGDEGKVFAFEPAPDNFCLLQMAIEANNCSNTVVHELAVMDDSGWVDLMVSELNHGDHRIFETREKRKGLRVRSTSLDELLAGEPRIDFVKVDVQGAEALVLRGMRQLIRPHADLTILMEFSPQLLRAANTEPLEVLEEIQKLGLQVSELNRNGDVFSSKGARRSLAFSSTPTTLVLTRK